ncbi:MAG: MCE family protein [Myxococcales bacterium]|nr:MCE family protein [Myxococcales bacterium]
MNKQIRVGLFVTLGALVAGILIFLVGDERHMFERKAVLHATFHDVSGLKVGSPVRMGGVDVGFVERIEFGNTDADHNIHVYFSMVNAQITRVRTDSIVRIVAKGLLGDKALDVSMGQRGTPLHDGATLQSNESDDIGSALSQAGQILGRANDVLTNVTNATRPLADPQLGRDVLALVHNLNTITHQVAEGPGTVHELLTNDATARRLDATLASAQHAANRAAESMNHVESIAREARQGRGLVHALVYDREGAQMVRSLATLSDEVASMTHDVRTGNGGLHQIIYGQESARAAANVEQITADVRAMMGDVRAGRGTLGALLVDPSLYEDIKSLVGNVQRNEILRAMVRYSIHQDDAPQAPVNAQPAQGNR